MNRKLFAMGAGFLALVMTGSSAHAFGNACKNVNFSVDNHLDCDITVQRIELYSASEGRWLNENFPNSFVSAGKQDATVKLNEDVEYAENDRITALRVHYKTPAGSQTYTDYKVDDPICVADRWYNADVGGQ